MKPLSRPFREMGVPHVTFAEVEDSDAPNRRSDGKPQSPSGDEVTIPECNDGMKTGARKRLVTSVTTKNPRLRYDCQLSRQASSESGGSFGGTREESPDETNMHSTTGLGLAFQEEKRQDYKLRQFLVDAVKSWENDLKGMDGSMERFGCSLSTPGANYRIICFFA
ncbi:hypothetical protein Aduo_014473 [Ancylostoma duodenale]